MLLPESNRSRLPFVASLTIQCSLVLLLAIPWTVQTLRSSTPVPLPIMLNLRPPRPIEPHQAKPIQNATNNSLSIPSRQPRAFQPPLVNSNGSNLSSLPAPPEITFGTGGPTGLVGAARVSDLLVRSAATPTAVPPAQTQTESQAQVVIGGNVQAAKLIRQERPMYPTLARQVRVQGVVTLEAIIGIDGTIQQLRVLGGHPLLVPSAIQAVQQWVYRPTILNGKVVEIKTTIEVRFTLSER